MQGSAVRPQCVAVAKSASSLQESPVDSTRVIGPDESHGLGGGLYEKQGWQPTRG